MRVPQIVLAAFLLGVLGGCKRSADPEQLAIVDSLLVATDSMISSIKAVDIPQVRRIDSLYALKADRVEKRMRDTLRKEDAIVLANYHRTMSKYAGRTLQWHASALDKLELSRTQLTNLHHDLDKGLLEPTEALKYVMDERMAFAKLRRDVEQVFAAAATVIRDDEAYRSSVDSLLATDTIPVP